MSVGHYLQLLTDFGPYVILFIVITVVVACDRVLVICGIII
jgi:hypothetical protein